MNRRDLMKRIVGVSALAGIGMRASQEAHTVTVTQEPPMEAAEFCPQCGSVSCKLQAVVGEDWQSVDEALQKLSAEPLTGGRVLPDYNAGVTWGKP